ncbi:MAG: AAA family ATPase [Dermatophilaceae bacterium]
MGAERATLVVLGGLPGTGKTTVARVLARRLGAVHVRVDSIEQALRDAGLVGDMGPLGYAAAYALALDQLTLGLPVVADSVNPLELTRSAWRQVAAQAGARVVEVELTCSNEAEHRRRVTTRVSDVPGLHLPTWVEVVTREFEPWRPDLSLDTTRLRPHEAAALVADAVTAAREGGEVAR